MQWQTKVSDTDFVEGIRLFNRRRRNFQAVMMFVIAATNVGLMLYFRRTIEGALRYPTRGSRGLKLASGLARLLGKAFSGLCLALHTASVCTLEAERIGCWFHTTVASLSWASCRLGHRNDHDQSSVSLDDVCCLSFRVNCCVAQHFVLRLLSGYSEKLVGRALCVNQRLTI